MFVRTTASRRFIRSCCVAALLTGVAPAVALAETAKASDSALVSDVVVTATRRSESVQKIPQSVTAVSQEEILARGFDKFEDYTKTIPGLIFSAGGPNTGTFQLRGISTSTNTANTQSPVAVYYDDMPALTSYAPRIKPDLRLFDVGRIEVLRGPQGTLFGSGALSGAIRVITNKPDLTAFHSEVEATGSGTKGGSGSYALNGMINAPLAKDTLGLRVVGFYRKDGGWLDHPAYGGTNDNSSDSYGGRAMLRWAPTDRLTLTAFGSYQHDHVDDDNYSNYSVGPTNQFINKFPEGSSQKMSVANLTGEYQADWATLISSTTYMDQTPHSLVDYSATLLRLYTLSTPAPDVIAGHTKVFTQEVRVVSKIDGPLQYVVGAFYSHMSRNGTETITVPGAGVILAPRGYPTDQVYAGYSPIRTKEAAIFGEVSYQLTDKIKATTGARAFHDTFNLHASASGIFNGGVTSNDRSSKESQVTPKFSLSYQTMPNLMLYAQAAKGYRVGASAVSPAVDPVTKEAIPQYYGPDSLWNYELGAKSTWFDQRLILNVAAYYIDWTNIQLQIRSPGGLVYITNAGNARSKGVELEARAKPTDWLELGTALSFNRAEITSLAPGGRALIGDRLPGAPRFTASNFARVSFPINDTFSGYVYVDHARVGKSFVALNNPTSMVIGDYSTFGARVGVVSGPWEATAFVNNIGNSDGKVAANALPAGNGAARLRPRTGGVTLRRSF